MYSIRSMISNTSLSLFLWGKTLKTVIHMRIGFLVRLYKEFYLFIYLWTNKKPSLNHVHIWGCLIEARIFNPYEMKLAPRTISCYIGYPKRSKGYRFYRPNHITRIVETRNVKFLENDSDNGALLHEWWYLKNKE